MSKEELVKDFQKWAISQNYSFSGAADPWIAAYEFYKEHFKEVEKENKSLRRILKSHSEIILINADLRAKINELTHLVDHLEGKNRL
jgi:hypothetical protein